MTLTRGTPCIYIICRPRQKWIKVQVKVTLVQALRLRSGRTAHRGSRGIALPFHDHGTRRWWGKKCGKCKKKKTCINLTQPSVHYDWKNKYLISFLHVPTFFSWQIQFAVPWELFVDILQYKRYVRKFSNISHRVMEFSYWMSVWNCGVNPPAVSSFYYVPTERPKHKQPIRTISISILKVGNRRAT